MGYFTVMICPWDKKKKEGPGGSLGLLESLTIKKWGAVTGTVWEKMEGKQTEGGNLTAASVTSMCFVFAAALRQFGPDRCCLERCEGGILLDAEAAERNTGRDSFSILERKENREETT